MDVPLIVFVAVSEVYHEDVMLEPGAKMSRQAPKFEYDARASCGCGVDDVDLHARARGR